ncbi:TPA: lipopolysaccharide biosynthesis protein [Enterococcus faecium]
MISQRKYGAILSYLNIVLKNITNFIYTPILLRLVGQGDYGLFQMTNSVATSLTLLSMGFSSAYIKFYMSYKTDNKKKELDILNGMYLIMFIVIGLIALIVGLLITLKTESIFGQSLTSKEIALAKKLMLILVINIALTFPSSVFDANIMVNQHFVFQQSRQILQTVLVPIISLSLIFCGFGILSIGITQVMLTFLFLVINIRYCLKKLKMRFIFKEFSLKLFKQITSFSLFILLNQVVDMVNNNGPNFILGILKGSRDVAIFAIAMQIKNMFLMLSTSLSTIFIPKVNELVSSNSNKSILTKLMVDVGRLQLCILFFILGGFIVLGQFFINIWAGTENSESYLLVIIMVLPSIIPFSQNIGIEIQRALDKHIFRSISYSIFAIMNIVITFIGAKYMGLVGATFGYVISILVANGLVMNWYYHTKMSLDMKFFWRNTIKVIIPFITTTSILLLAQIYFPVNNYFKFVIFGIVYTFIYGFIYLLFIANSLEKQQLASIFKKK